MSTNQKTPKMPLPRGWKQHVRSAVLQVISLAQYATVYTRSWAANSIPEEFEAAREKARQTRAELNRKRDCEACELVGASLN